MSRVSKESSWLALRDAVGAVMSALAPTTANEQAPSREKRRKE
jgi:hypothetical protein